MTLLYASDQFLQHDTGQHPEHPIRLQTVRKFLHESGLADRCTRQPWHPVARERLELVHSPEHREHVRQFAAGHAGERIEADTVVSRDSYDVAMLACGAVCDAVQRVTAGEAATALCLVRPPGHHALPNAAMGFCLFNQVAVAARLATEVLGLDRVLVVDWDVHHGNGTQDAFWTDERVAFLSIHRWPFYPGTGRAEETGGGSALGTKCNIPLPFGTSRDAFRDQFRLGLESLADRIKPQLILLSAGFDAHHADPIGSLGLEEEDFAALTRIVLNVADAHAGGKLVSTLEGGYNPPVLARCVGEHLTVLLERDSL